MPGGITTDRGGVAAASSAGDVLDLDALLAERRLEPVSVKLGGHVYRVRRDLTAAENREFETQLALGKDGDRAAFALILGADDAGRFLAHTTTLPAELDELVTQKIVVAAGLRQASQFPWGKENSPAEDDAQQGEAAASSPA